MKTIEFIRNVAVVVVVVVVVVIVVIVVVVVAVNIKPTFILRDDWVNFGISFPEMMHIWVQPDF